jgi:hypothetical protein
VKSIIERIGQPSQSSWPRRFRRWLNEMFGSDYVRLLERDLVQARIERDRAQMDLKATQERLLEVMAATKDIPWRPIAPQEKTTAKPVTIPQTNWQQLQAQAIEENVRLEAEEAKSAAAAKEN